MKRYILSLLALLCAVTLIYSDDDTTDEESESKYFKITTKRYTNYLGFAGGLITGNGLAYRKWFKDKVGFQLNAMPFYKEEIYPEDSDSDDDRDSGYYNIGFINYGGAFLINFSDVPYIRFLGYAGFNHIINLEKGDYYYTKREWDSNIGDYIIESKHYKKDRTENTLAGGIGAGVEFYVFRFGFSLMLGFYGSYSLEDKTKTIGPSVDGGVFFRF